MKQKLVVVGNGMAGLRVLEKVLEAAPNRYEIAVFGAEPREAYNRVTLAPLLAGEATPEDLLLRDGAWYARHGVALHTGVRITEIDRVTGRIVTDAGDAHAFDRLVLATGARPAHLGVPGESLPGVTGFRDLDDVHHLVDVSHSRRRAIVVGGGLLGIEAAHGLARRGMEVTIVHLPEHLMEQQLDARAAAHVQRSLEARGIHVRLASRTQEILGEHWVRGVRLADGVVLPADLVVVACGIEPEVSLAAQAGLRCGRGVIVDDGMRTDDARIFAVGECAEHRGQTYGLLAPLYEQARECARQLTDASSNGRYAGTVTTARLKVTGIEVLAAGCLRRGDDDEEIVSDTPQAYRRIVLRGGRVVGVLLYGDTSEASFLLDLLHSGADVQAHWDRLVLGRPLAPTPHRERSAATAPARARESLPFAANDVAPAAALARPTARSADQPVCACHGVSQGRVLRAIDGGACDAAAIRRATGAGSSCGSCRPVIDAMLAPAARHEDVPAAICGCTDLGHDALRAQITGLRLRRLEDVFTRLGWRSPDGCARCRPAVNYYLLCAWPKVYRDDVRSRPPNERVHANIQRDGTYSVVPRMFGGIVTPEQLRALADIAERFDVRTVKITGGQRIDLLGVRKEMLPAIWQALGAEGFVSGHAYAKGVRTVKTCVGSDWCRYGVQDSTALGIELEEMCWGAWAPHKFKMAVSGCNRNCAESTIKDFGVVAVDDGWDIYVGGNGGMRVRAADYLEHVHTELEVFEHCGAFLQLYREEGWYLERTARFVERVGIDYVRERLVADPVGRGLLFERFHQAQRIGQKDPWAERVQGVEAAEFVPLSRLTGEAPS